MDINLTGQAFNDYKLTDVGSDAYQLEHDWFTKEDLVITTGAGGGGTPLSEGTDYQLSEEDEKLSERVTKAVGSTRTVYHYITIINATYQTGDLYHSGKYIADSNSAADMNDFEKTHHKLLHIQDQKSQDTSGGSFTSGAYRTRDLNTIITNDIPGASLASDQIILPAGKYFVIWTAPAHAVDRNRSRLYDTTGSAVLVFSSNDYAGSGSLAMDQSIGGGIFTLSVQSVLELQHQCEETYATYGFGLACNFSGESEIYSDIKIWKIA